MDAPLDDRDRFYFGSTTTATSAPVLRGRACIIPDIQITQAPSPHGNRGAQASGAGRFTGQRHCPPQHCIETHHRSGWGDSKEGFVMARVSAATHDVLGAASRLPLHAVVELRSP